MVTASMAESKALVNCPKVSQDLEIIEIAKDCAYLCTYIYQHGNKAVENMASGLAHIPAPNPSSPLSEEQEAFINHVSEWVEEEEEGVGHFRVCWAELVEKMMKRRKNNKRMNRRFERVVDWQVEK